MNENTKPSSAVDIADENFESSDAYDPRQYPNATPVEPESAIESDKRYKIQFWVYPALAPFVYVLLGMMLRLPHWWSLGWVIIPISAIVSVKMPKWVKLVSLSPFIFVFVGMMNIIPGWWAWGWMIIPIFGILSAGVKRRW